MSIEERHSSKMSNADLLFLKLTWLNYTIFLFINIHQASKCTIRVRQVSVFRHVTLLHMDTQLILNRSCFLAGI